MNRRIKRSLAKKKLRRNSFHMMKKLNSNSTIIMERKARLIIMMTRLIKQTNKIKKDPNLKKDRNEKSPRLI